MIHWQYECKVNFVKLPLILIYRCLKLIFENAIAGRNTGCHSVVNRTHQTFPRTPKLPLKCRDNEDALMTDAVHTRACAGMKERS
jgi:hypothetical protein